MPPVTLPTTPYAVTADTFLIPTLAPAAGVPGYVGAHSLVIRGTEPVIVDTGCSLVRDAWLANVFSVVEPHDVRWIFLSHDDHDHIGNVDAVLAACPNATLVTNFSMVGRLAGDVEFPPDRMRWLDAGDALDAGDRRLTLVRPPLFDSPATRGLYDSATNLLWAVDTFGALFAGAAYEASDIPGELFDESFVLLNSWNTPWLEWVDPERFAAHVRRTAALPIDVVASAHGPILRADRIEDAFRRTLALAAQPAIPTPGQEFLDQLLASFTAVAAA